MRIQSTLLLLACAWPVAAQEGGTTPPAQQKNKPATGAMTQSSAMVVKGETVLGTDIRAGGEDIGDVKDFVVDRDGQILYAILDIDEGDDKRVAVPWNALKTSVKSEGGDRHEFDVVVDKERLRTAPSFTEDKWPNLASSEWARETDEFFRDIGDTSRPRPAGTPADETAGARPAGMARSMTVRATKLQGLQVDTSSGKNAGEIENLAVDPKNGRIAFVVLSTGGFLGLGEDHHAIPLQAFTFSREEDDADDMKCRLNIPESKLENAPKFDKSKWDDADDVVFIEKIYSHYGYPAYWSGSAMKEHSMDEKPGEAGDKAGDDEDDRK